MMYVDVGLPIAVVVSGDRSLGFVLGRRFVASHVAFRQLVRMHVDMRHRGISEDLACHLPVILS